MNKDQKPNIIRNLLNGFAIPLTIILVCIGCAIGGQIIQALGPWMFSAHNWDTPPGAGPIARAIGWGAAFFFYGWLVDRLLRMS